jgi:hypothetical protein
MPPPRLLKRAKNDIKHDRANSRAIMMVNESPPLSSNGVFTTALIENIPTRTTSQKMVVDENGEIYYSANPDFEIKNLNNDRK